MLRCLCFWTLFVAFSEARSQARYVPKPIPADIASITARFKQMQSSITHLQTKAQEVTAVIAQVETVGGDTLARVDASEKKLIETSAKAALNKYRIEELRNQTDGAEAEVKEVLKDMKELLKVVEQLDSTSMNMGSQAQKVATQVSDLEDKVKRLMPGESGLTERIEKAKATLAKYEQEVGPDLDGMVEKSLRGHFVSATNRLQTLAEDVAARRAE